MSDETERSERHARAYASIAENLVRCINKLRSGRLFYAGGWHRDAHATCLERLLDAPKDDFERTRRALDFFDNVGTLMQHGRPFEKAVATTASNEWRQPAAQAEQLEARDVPVEVPCAVG
jgi:hypothetical protein